MAKRRSGRKSQPDNAGAVAAAVEGGEAGAPGPAAEEREPVAEAPPSPSDVAVCVAVSGSDRAAAGTAAQVEQASQAWMRWQQGWASQRVPVL